MIKTQLLKYIKASIEDEHAMEVLYFCIKDAALRNGFAFDKTTSIIIDGKFHGEAIQIGINNRFQSQIKTIALLLSVRALMQDKNYLKCCADDYLIFTSSVFGKFQWIEFTTIIHECMDDDEFYHLYEILEELYFNDTIPDEAIAELRESTTVPEYKGLNRYYKNIASTNEGIVDEVICNNAFVNEDFETYEVPGNIAYVGNTAFSYCSNLNTIKFTNKVFFGLFPIIECNNLTRIIVPTEYVDYYKAELPYYELIITDSELSSTIDQTGIEPAVESNKGKRWTIDEEEKVKRFFGLGHSFKVIAKAMGRTEVAIKARLGKLGLINYTYTKDEGSHIEPSDNSDIENEVNAPSLSDAIKRSLSFTSPQQYFNFFKSYAIDLPDALEILFTANTFCAAYALVKIAGDSQTCEQAGWRQIEESDIKANRQVASKNELSKTLYPILFLVLREKKCPIKHIGTIPVEVLDYPTFKIAFTDHLARKNEKERKTVYTSSDDSAVWFNSSKGWSTSYKESWPYKKSSPKPHEPLTETKKEDDSPYDKFEYGLSDW